MKPRSEAEQIAESDIEVILGGKRYTIRPLGLLASMEWRKEYGPRLSTVMAVYAKEAEAPADFLTAFCEAPQLMIDALFAYAPNLPQKQILAKCTEMEMMRAFSQVMGVAFGPFLGETAFLYQFKKELDKILQPPASEPFSKLQ